MSPETQMILVLLAFYTLTLVFGVFAFFIIKRNIQKIMFIMKNNKLFRSKEEARQKMLEKGDLHDWKQYDYFGNGKMMLRICRKTGWCPETKSYFDLNVLAALDRTEKQKEEQKKFRDSRMQQLSEKYNVTLEKMEEIAEDVFKIKKDWHIQLMNKTMDELKEQFGEKKSEGNKV